MERMSRLNESQSAVGEVSQGGRYLSSTVNNRNLHRIIQLLEFFMHIH